MESIAKNTNKIGINAYRKFAVKRLRGCGYERLFIRENDMMLPIIGSFGEISAELGAAAFFPDERGFGHQVSGQNHVAQFIRHPFGEGQAPLPGGKDIGGGGEAFLITDNANLIPHQVFQIGNTDFRHLFA